LYKHPADIEKKQSERRRHRSRSRSFLEILEILFLQAWEKLEKNFFLCYFSIFCHSDNAHIAIVHSVCRQKKKEDDTSLISGRRLLRIFGEETSAHCEHRITNGRAFRRDCEMVLPPRAVETPVKSQKIRNSR
jgi:hypothetical protein